MKIRAAGDHAWRCINRLDGLLVASLILGAAFLLPIVRSPLLGDDAFNSYLSGYMLYHGQSWWQFMHEYDARLIKTVGRWIPVMTLMFIAVWSTTQDAVPVKTLQIIAIVADMWIFFAFVRRIAGSRDFAIIATLLVIPTFQIRLFYDPVAGIMLGMQVVLGASLVAAMMFWDYLVDGKRWKLALSVFLYVVAMLTYETAYLYVLVFVAIAYIQRRSVLPALAACAVPIVAFIILVAKDLYLRHTLPNQASEYTIAFRPAEALHTWWYQTIGAIPLEYLYYNPKQYFPALSHVVLRPTLPALAIALLAFGIAIAIFHTVGKRIASETHPTPWLQITVLGLLLLCLPGVPLAFSPRWQLEIIPGQAYLPVFDAGFGTALLLAAVLWALTKRHLARLTVVVAVALCYTAVLLTVFQANAITLKLWDPGWNWGRQNIVQALKDGIISRTPENSSIFLDQSYPFFYDPAYIWDTQYLIYLYTHKRVAVLDPATEAGRNSACGNVPYSRICIPHHPTFKFYSSSSSYETGYVSLVDVAALARISPGQSMPLGSHAWILDRGNANGATRPAGAATSLSPGDFQLVASGSDYRLFEVRSACGPINAGVFAGEDRDGLTFGVGFYGEEQGGGNSWRWSTQHSQLTVANNVGTAQAVDVTFTVQALVPGPSTLIISDGGREQRTRLTAAPLPYRLHIRLGAQSVDTIHFATDAPKPAALTDPRDLHFGVFNARVSAETNC